MINFCQITQQILYSVKSIIKSGISATFYFFGRFVNRPYTYQRHNFSHTECVLHFSFFILILDHNDTNVSIHESFAFNSRSEARIHGEANSCRRPKTAIFGCIMRKAPYRPTEAYLAYVRVGYKGLDKIRR